MLSLRPGDECFCGRSLFSFDWGVGGGAASLRGDALVSLTWCCEMVLEGFAESCCTTYLEQRDQCDCYGFAVCLLKVVDFEIFIYR